MGRPQKVTEQTTSNLRGIFKKNCGLLTISKLYYTIEKLKVFVQFCGFFIKHELYWQNWNYLLTFSQLYTITIAIFTTIFEEIWTPIFLKIWTKVRNFLKLSHLFAILRGCEAQISTVDHYFWGEEQLCSNILFSFKDI